MDSYHCFIRFLTHRPTLRWRAGSMCCFGVAHGVGPSAELGATHALRTGALDRLRRGFDRYVLIDYYINGCFWFPQKVVGGIYHIIFIINFITYRNSYDNTDTLPGELSSYKWVNVRDVRLTYPAYSGKDMVVARIVGILSFVSNVDATQ